MEKWINILYHNAFIRHIFHTSVYCLQRELKGCNSVLDLGCGPFSPLRHCSVRYALGVDAFLPYLEKSKYRKIHTNYIMADISSLVFPPNSFDAVIMIEVLEHLTKEEGKKLLVDVERWAKKKIIVSSPNGFIPQKEIDQNSYQAHRSGWSVDEMRMLGYQARGMAGWKFLRNENLSENVEEAGAIFSTIRFHPAIFWLMISELTQAITYYFPKLAFEIFYVKIVKKSCET
jgi:ubiquinone/menaquinone biosynthesis C-methylase UbiE